MGATTLQPGESTSLGIAMMMHRGMEGPHRFRLSLPVSGSAAAPEVLSVIVSADFR